MMLSSMLRFIVVDRAHHRAGLLDLLVDLTVGDYPRVTELIYHDPHDTRRRLPWEAVEDCDTRARQFVVADLSAGREAPPDSLEATVRLNRDILDALLIDLEQRCVTRANDLYLALEDKQLWLKGVDTGPAGLVRQLTKGRWPRERSSGLRDWKYVEYLRGDPEAARRGADYHRRIDRLQPGEIARLLERLPYRHAVELLILLSEQMAADTLQALSDERQLQVFLELTEEHAAQLVARMAPDHAADLLAQLEPEDLRRLLARLPGRQRRRIIELLRYPENAAGGIMTNDILWAPAGLTVAEVRATLHKALREPDFAYFVFAITDEDSRRLCGILTLRDLMVADEGQRLEAIMNRYVQTVHVLDPADRAARRVIESDLAALPVVGAEGRLLGAITIDAAVRQVAPLVWRTQAPRVFS
jgi:magnesium transporter